MKTYLLTILLVTNISYSVANDESFITKIHSVVQEITGSTIWNLSSNNISGFPDHFDRFGEAVSHGDYNDDGIQDLAIGIPNHDANIFGTSFTNSGTVLIIYGSPVGLASANHQFLYQTFETSPPSVETANGVEANDFFGKSLASGDFNCDGITDLAVGTPDEGVTISAQFRNAVGAVNVFYGQTGGFNVLGQGSTFLVQPGHVNNLEEGDRFGWSMAVGSFNDSLCDDLAISAPFDDIGSNSDAGQVTVYYGKEQGLSDDIGFVETLSQFSDDLPDTESETHDQFGYSLTAGDYSLAGIGANGFDSLAVGIPGEDVNNITNAGAVQVFEGGSNGIDLQNTSVIWSQAGDIRGIVEEHDRFGSSLTTGDFNNDFVDDLAIGVPREDLNNAGINDAGSINIIYGDLFGLSAIGNQSFHQNTPGIDGGAETSDRFGDVLTAGDLNGDGADDIVIGVPRENNSKGAFHILYGRNGTEIAVGGITVDNSIFEKNLGDGENLDEMGYAMTIADFGNGTEIAVGIPGDDSSFGDNDAGSVEVFEFPQPIDGFEIPQPDLIFADDFED